MPWRENSCDREKRWRGCPERALGASWRKRRSDNFIDAISLSLFLNIHCIWSRASDLFRATALLAFYSTYKARRWREGTSDWLFRATPSRDSQLSPVYDFTYLWYVAVFGFHLRFSPSNMR